ncbi:MAG: spore coat protein [Bacilli bacterium]|nr:spore coat protein [Bacilli bacterium]
MKKIPNMISTKDLSYISDMFNWNIVAAKKYDYYLNQCEDEECVKLLNELSDLHHQICEDLLNLIEGNDG